MPILAQDPAYHQFADQVTRLGIPNFWNVVSNLPFMAVAAYGMQRRVHSVISAGLAGVAIGSAYYHWKPTNETLFWDRMPMAVVFMAILAFILDKPRWLWPLVIGGVGSVVYWRWTGELLPYAIVQFGSLAAIAVTLIVRSVEGARWIWLAMALYAVAKVLELADHTIGGGHAWKHAVAAAAMLAYVRSASIPRPQLRARASGTGR